jgi:murein DD-endopeptidase MepM/ murein hydrolase activator NlpD
MAEEVYAHPIGKPGARISSPYGPRKHPVTGEYQSLHNGLDIPAPEGTPVFAFSSGTVSKVASDSVSGNYVKVEHSQLFTTGYLHLSKVLVQPGQQVTAGTVIGLVGSTGRVTGPHLHFIVYRAGKPVDPAPYVQLSVLPELAQQAMDAAKTAAQNYWWVLPLGAAALFLFVALRKRSAAEEEEPVDEYGDATAG